MEGKTLKTKLVSYEDMLKAIDRTHLFFSNNADAERLVGLKLTPNNGLVKKGGKDPFLKKAIFHELSDVAKEITDKTFSLQDFLYDYEMAYNYYKTLQRTAFFNTSGLNSKERQNKQYSIADYFLKYSICYLPRPNKLSKNLNLILDEVFSIDEGYGKVVTILILLFMDILPPFEKGRPVLNIKEDFDKLYDFCMWYVGSNKDLVNQIPEMPLVREELDMLSDLELCRLYLYYYAYTLFVTIQGYGDSSSRHLLSSTIKINSYSRYRLDGFWQSPESLHIFWQFQQMNDSPEYIVRKWRRESRGDKVVYLYSSYFLIFNSKSEAMIKGPKYVYHAIKSNRLWGGDVSYFKVSANDDFRPTELIFKKQYTLSPIFPERLKKTTFSIYFDQLPAIINDEKDIPPHLREVDVEGLPYYQDLCNLCSSDDIISEPEEVQTDYLFTPALHAISTNAIYIINNYTSEFRYYRVPTMRDESLYCVSMTDTIGLLKMGGKKYIAFFDQNLFFDLEEELMLQQEEEKAWEEYDKQKVAGLNPRLPRSRIDWITQVDDCDEWTL